jgi:hypothetical protein
MALKQAIYVGATIRAASEAEGFISPVRVPGNCTKPETIAAKRREMETERLDDRNAAPTAVDDDNTYHKPILGVLSSVHVLDDDCQAIFSASTQHGGLYGTVARPFLQFLLSEYSSQFGNALVGADVAASRVIFGFGIKDVLRIAAFEVLGKSAGGIAVPVRLWYNPTNVYDPVDVAFTAGQQRDLDSSSLLRYCSSAVGTNVLDMDAQTQAHAVWTIVQRLQLLPS